MIVADHMNLLPVYIQKAAGWLRDGSLKSEETVVNGIENTLAAFFGLMSGANTGKMLVRLS
jgi:NADPH-dependent curcumin reductase CurA